ncbi:hypothetical protein H5410_005232 [Solanum commersonii]|uniref:DUF4283 domain-containing protein n=1 Tax=Solanum commersonii TaxID=4109 RepID=A0A9J6A5U6_SOLCO|nr:hypothetical protein H5410_005232 [Solanum commersonii]
MARGRKRKEVTKLVVTPTRKESVNLEYPQGMEVNQGSEPMEQWPPLPSREVTPKTGGNKQPVVNLGSGKQEGTSTSQPNEMQERVLRDDTQRQIDLNDEPKKWASFFNSNRMSAKGMGLNYINPIMRNGEQVIELKKEEIEKSTEEWKQALILYIVGESPTIAAIERCIALQVNTVSKPKVYYHNDGYFLVRLANLDDRNEVLYSGPHMMNNKPIIVKVWSAEFDFNKEVLQTVPIWVKYPNLPLSCWSQDSLSRISSGLGVPLYADECTTKVERISFARVLVEMDVARELPKKLKVEDPHGRVFEQAVQYEWIPEYCTKCMQVGHQCNKEEGNKPKTTEVAETEINVKRKEKEVEEAGAWQLSPRTATRGNLVAQGTTVRVLNGFRNFRKHGAGIKIKMEYRDSR